MTYRDERDALKARVENLEEDLADERAARPKRAWVKPLAIGLLLGVALFGAGALFLRSRAAPPAPPPVAEPAKPVDTAPPEAPPAETAPAETPPPRQIIATEEAVRRARPRWSATVKKVEGAPIAKGSTCKIEALVEAHGTNAMVPELVLTCGRTKLYDKGDKIDGIGKRDNDAREVLGPRDDQSTFTLQFSDVGARKAPATQIDLDSRKGEGVVWRDGASKMRVELTLKTESAPTAALSGPSERLRGRGKVVEATGAARVKKGAACLFRAIPTGQGVHCIAEVKCGGTVLAPQTTPVACTYDGARPLTVVGTASPSIKIDGGNLTVVSTQPAWKAVIELDAE